MGLTRFDTPAAYYHWKNGKTLPSIEHLLVLSELFEKHIEDIIIWTRPPPSSEGRDTIGSFTRMI